MLSHKPGETQENVRKVIDLHPESINDSGALLIWYWVEIDGAVKREFESDKLVLHQWRISTLTSPGAILRAFHRVLKSRVESLK